MLKLLHSLLASSILSIFVFIACGEDEEDVSTVTSCVISSIQNEGTAQEMDLSACVETTAPESSTSTIEAACTGGTIINDEANANETPTYAATECTSVSAGVPGCLNFPSRHGGTQSIWYTGDHYVSAGESAISTWCTAVGGTVTTKE